MVDSEENADVRDFENNGIANENGAHGNYDNPNGVQMKEMKMAMDYLEETGISVNMIAIPTKSSIEEKQDRYEMDPITERENDR